MRVLKGAVEATDTGKPKTTSVSIAHKRTVSFERTLDIRGMRVDEATEALIAYLDDAQMVGADRYCKDAMETVGYAKEIFG